MLIQTIVVCELKRSVAVVCRDLRQSRALAHSILSWQLVSSCTFVLPSPSFENCLLQGVYNELVLSTRSARSYSRCASHANYEIDFRRNLRRGLQCFTRGQLSGRRITSRRYCKFPPTNHSFSCSLTRQGDAKFLVAYPTNFSVWRVGRKGSQADNGRRALLRV